MNSISTSFGSPLLVRLSGDSSLSAILCKDTKPGLVMTSPKTPRDRRGSRESQHAIRLGKHTSPFISGSLREAEGLACKKGIVECLTAFNVIHLFDRSRPNKREMAETPKLHLHCRF